MHSSVLFLAVSRSLKFLTLIARTVAAFVASIAGA